MPGEAALQIEPSFITNTPEAERAFREAPDGLKTELLRGMVCMAPAPAPIHQVLAGRLYRRLGKYDGFDGGGSDPRGWVFLLDAEVNLGERPDKFRPDVAGWTEERATFSLQRKVVSIAPNWVCEVLSPSTETIDRGTKAPLYAEHGVEWLWFIDPESKCIEVFHNEAGTFRPVRSFRESDTGSLAPFEAATLDGFFGPA